MRCECRGAEVQLQRFAEVQRCRLADWQRCAEGQNVSFRGGVELQRWAEVCRGLEVLRCRDSESCRGAEVQMCSSAEVHRFRGVEV